MNFVDFQKYVGTLATKYSDFEFNIRIYDLEGLSSDKYVDYDGKDSKHIEFPEKRQGSLMIEAGFGPTSLLDNIITKIKSKAAELGLQQYDNLQYDAGPYVWATIIFSVKDSDVTSDFPLERLEEFVEVIHSVLEPYQISDK
jgi:hypothetical protein|tara:strand:+ start:723 stop:1148 length:426 start_codon:yes stop_codon:yes gene_type:complete